jgi:N6-adenosine-specific RNA methylase IME4
MARKVTKRQPINNPDDMMKCHVKNVFYDFVAKAGIVHLPAGECVDMEGCINYFWNIDHDVRFIATFAGDFVDTCYERVRWGWIVAIDGPTHERHIFRSSTGVASTLQ